MTKGWGYLLLTSLACDNDRDCVQLDATCSPLYEPTFDNVYEQTLVQSCGVGAAAATARKAGREAWSSPTPMIPGKCSQKTWEKSLG